PMSVAIEKLRGFIADHKAEVLSVDDRSTMLEFQTTGWAMFRRSSDRKVLMYMRLDFSEDQVEFDRHTGSQHVVTRIDVSVILKRSRDRRKSQAIELARNLLSSLRSYLMASEEIEALEAV
ncbi:MAG: hypothetical protein MPJ50_04210, partial [Pirellulales bacterium]|nr:hypothetical protein [Pirellulales bacterium]